MPVTIYHNPRCSKSRATLALLRERGIEPHVIEYLVTPPDVATLRSVLRALGRKPLELVRRGEAAWQELALPDDADETTLLQAMVEHPVLIERPIVVCDKRAVIGRPPEAVLGLFDT